MYYFLLFLAGVPAAFEDLELLDERVSAAAPQAEAIDKRLKLAQCPDDPIIAAAIAGAVVVRCPALGWRLRVPIKVGPDPSTHNEVIVRKGEMVECMSAGPGFAVSTMMLALDDAGAGQPVRVKSLTSPLIVTAIAKARGQVSF